ncbi:hypothetical protein LJ707_11545 [Mucilaginibacter sp. UR6-1]|uniref:hypothetical protein n=1 Tax=Mucilaginibacter sp. UR6-1 TaxID=1435643 RepID=UPI001E432AB4|nr:hypothetical protein [Mucilaginibacter sp. UR6-1]MCC8409568.1 hypothetical protein [Mucilaginibacter sp. UR6-1]
MKNKSILFTLSTICVLSFSACEKNQNVEPSATNKDSVLTIEAGKSKDQAIKKFMSISFGVDTANITYDAISKEYTLFGQLKLKRDSVEKNYDQANEYKAKYESQTN